LLWQQRWDRKQDDAAPRENPERCHGEASVHWFTLSTLVYLASRFAPPHLGGVSPQAKVRDLRSRVRCRGCGARRQAVVLVKWAPQCESQVLDTLAEGLRSYRITAEASFQIATQRPSDRSKIRSKDAPRYSRGSRTRFPSDRTDCFREATKKRSSNGVLLFPSSSVVAVPCRARANQARNAPTR
jgi:hypothetical protein